VCAFLSYLKPSVIRKRLYVSVPFERQHINHPD
jgi:hypothetical protein